ncbi:hypothetical protein P43SY_009425 [Pythium insidiosum]|uniref:Cytochrome P450 n=1 Tax=Pythium insidiosum TaxID=114742 RepID=A0AAD5M4D4_PYTIN|nr:hypothetical protein P43SY_009425 [Pythium insidiosum]
MTSLLRSSALLPPALDVPLRWLLLLSLLLLLCATLLLDADKRARAVRHLPTPASTLPLLKNTLDIALFQRRRLYCWLLDETLRHGGRTWRLKVLGRPQTVVVASLETFDDVLKLQFEAFGKGETLPCIMRDVMGGGIIAADGPAWLEQRKAASALFSLQILRDNMDAVVRNHGVLLCQRLRELSRRDGPVDLKRLFDLFTLDVFTKIGFGVDLHGLEDDTNHLAAFDRCSQVLLQRFREPMWLWRVKRALSLGPERQLRRDVKALDALLADVISQSLADKTRRRRSDADADDGAAAGAGGRPTLRRKRSNVDCDLLSLFLDQQLREDAAVDAARLRDMAINFISAGRDTTSQSLAWFVLMMNREPSVLARIRAEIEHKLPRLRHANTVPSVQELQSLPFLEAAIRESLRLNPVVPLNSRTATRDVTLCDGTFVKAGTHVLLPIYALNRLPAVWGDDAAAFRPERWLDPATGELLATWTPARLASFSWGPRQCLGMRLALLELQMVLASVLSKFELTTARDPWSYSYAPSITLSIDGPLDVVVSAREQS